LRKAADSWRATLDVVHGAALRRDVPRQYERQVAELAAKELSKELEKNGDKLSAQTRDDTRRVIERARSLGAKP
jgi:hypothetical protein